jgi:protein gp37
MTDIDQVTEVPQAVFVEDVTELLKNRTSASVIQELGDKLQQYKLVESQLLTRRARLKSKLPELQKALDIVKLLISKEDQEDPILLDYGLSDQVYARC